MNKIEQAWNIARTEDVATHADSIVLYSISYLPTDMNKRLAQQYVASHPECRMLNDTPCGKKLIALGLETQHDCPDEELMKIWALASSRFIQAASGEVRAFVEHADKRSIFVAVELPQLLKNKAITKINGLDKFEFARLFNVA